MAYVIGVDCGTSGTKTVLFREDGTVMASATVEYPMYQPKNGYAEQDPADWKAAMIRTIQTVVTKSSVAKEEIKGIGIPDRCMVWSCWTRKIRFCGSRSSGATSVPPQRSTK